MSPMVGKIHKRLHIVAIILASIALLTLSSVSLQTDGESQQAAAAVVVPVVRILALGDSLTEGLYDWPKTSFSFHPYTERLKIDIDAYFQRNHTDVKIVVNNKGKSGERVHRAMVNRLRDLFKRSTRKYDIAIILAGTNDLLDITKHRKTTDQLSVPMVVHDILSLHRLCHWHGMKTAAISIPEASIESDTPRHDDFRSNRLHVNRVLQRYAARHPDDTVYVDVTRHLPLRSLDDFNRTRYWDDGLHFTPVGYDRMGTVVFEGIASSLESILSNKALGRKQEEESESLLTDDGSAEDDNLTTAS